jgi:hypothetical protein
LPTWDSDERDGYFHEEKDYFRVVYASFIAGPKKAKVYKKYRVAELRVRRGSI